LADAADSAAAVGVAKEAAAGSVAVAASAALVEAVPEVVERAAVGSGRG
jgi:hypothetical protein